MKIEIDTGNVRLTDDLVLEIVKLKQGAPDGPYYVLAKLVDAVEQAVADAKVCPKCGKRWDDMSVSLVGGRGRP